jgi:hypothetical protein
MSERDFWIQVFFDVFRNKGSVQAAVEEADAATDALKAKTLKVRVEETATQTTTR